MPTDDVLIIGAGPYGLSISAHLSHLGVPHTLIGRPMDTWRSHMPPGMMLRSEPYGSDLASPRPGYDVQAYADQHHLDDYRDRLGPLPIERLLDYTDWYVDALVQPAVDDTVTRVARTDDGFEVDLVAGGTRSARAVVVAPGLLPFTVLPAELSALPDHLGTHVSAHHDLARFAGRPVAVVGGGQSAVETLALLHEAGADARLVMRRDAINWLRPNPETLGPVKRLTWPVNKLCEGWHCAFWNSPHAFRTLPRVVRTHKARSVLGPAGAWWLKDRVEGKIPTFTGHRVVGAMPHGDGVRMVLDGPREKSMDVDHVIAATGYRVDLERLAFLDPAVRRGVVVEDGYPKVDLAGHSTVPGLYFAGAVAAGSLGPSVRFIAGTHNSSARLADAVARRHRQGSGATRSAVPAG